MWSRKMVTKAILIVWSVYTTWANNPVPGFPTPGVTNPAVTTLEFANMAACRTAQAQIWAQSVAWQGPMKGRTAINSVCIDSGKQKGEY
jgi:hypothetical protein